MGIYEKVAALVGRTTQEIRRIDSSLPVNAKHPRYGILGNGVADDTAKLSALISAAGSNEIYLPAGTYVCSSAIVKQNLGPFRLRGAGSDKTKILFNGTTGGLKVANLPETNIGMLDVDGVSFVCASNFAAGTVGLHLLASNYNNRGVRLNDVQVVGDGSHEWPVHIQIENSCFTYASNIWLKGLNWNTGTIGVKLLSSKYNNVGWPSVNHTFLDINAVAVGSIFDISSQGTPGVEGINLNLVRGVSVGKAINIVTSYVAPWITISNTHLECFNNPALYIDGAAQIQFGSTNCFYVHGSPANAVELRNCINVNGDIGQIISYDSIAYAVELSGTGGAMDFKFRHTPDDGQSKDLKIGPNLDSVYINTRRNWSGKTNSDRLDTVTDLSGKANLTGSGEKTPFLPALRTQYVSGTTTLDLSSTDLVQIGNGGSDVTYTINRTKLVTNRVYYFKRYNNSSGVVTLTMSDSNISFIQSPDGSFNPTFTLPITASNRQVGFFYDGAHLELMSL